jgi:hypothetical protein
MSQPDNDNLNSTAVIERLTDGCGRLDLPERLILVRRRISNRIAIASCFVRCWH